MASILTSAGIATGSVGATKGNAAIPEDLSIAETTAQRLRRAAESLVDLHARMEKKLEDVAFPQYNIVPEPRNVDVYPSYFDHLRTTAEIIEDEVTSIHGLLNRLAI